MRDLETKELNSKEDSIKEIRGSVIIAVHKKSNFIEQPGYLPIQVGAENHKNLDLGITKDNTGDNISEKNSIYCELTGMYWLWKNGVKTKYSGLVHYRRYFVDGISLFNNVSKILTIDEIDEILSVGGYSVILPRKISKKACNGRLKANLSAEEQDKPLFYTKKIIERDYPKYLDNFMNVALEDGKVSFGNMFICRYETFTKYCEFLFDVLKKLELDLRTVEPRMLGYVSEYLLCCWMERNFDKTQIKYMDVINTEDSTLKNYLKAIKNRL